MFINFMPFRLSVDGLEVLVEGFWFQVGELANYE